MTIIFRKANIKYFKPMLAKDFILSSDIKLSNFWMSEKLDGTRGIYHNGKLYSRSGNLISAPNWFLQGIKDNVPEDIILDGELYTKRNDFCNIVSITTNKVPNDREWKKIRFQCFDIPNLLEPFEERYKILCEIKERSTCDYFGVIQHIQIINKQHLNELFNNVTNGGGEGLMLRTNGSYYESTRSNSMLKYKAFKDAEVVVIDYDYGSGKNSGMLGSFNAEWLDKTMGKYKFNVGSGLTDEQRINYKTLFPKGSVLKIKYFEVTELGVPRFPVFLAKLS